MEGVMRYAVPYIRVSRADKKRGLTLEIQLDAIKSYAAHHGIALLDDLLYVDEGKSAYTNRIDKRPDFQRLLKDARSKDRRWSLVLVYKTDRFARDALLQLQCRRDLLKCGVATESATQYNPDDSAIGKLNIVLDAGLNEYYSALLSERMRDVRRFEATQQGRHVGPVPIGYDRKAGLLEQNDHSPAVLHAGQLYATGQYSAAQIADMLNLAGYVNADGEPFKVYAVEEMLKNPVYAGFVVLRGDIYPGKHQPIWDAALWSRMQQIQIQRSRRRLRPAVKHEPLLAGLIYCANCGAAMWHFPRDGWRSYRCCVTPSKRPGPIPDILCKDTWAHAEAVEATTLAWISALALTPDLLEHARARLQQTCQPTAPNLDIELRKLKQAFLAERLSAAAYEEQRTALMNSTGKLPPQTEDPDALVSLLRDLPTLLTHTTNIERRSILQQLITEVYARQKAVIAFRPTRLAERLFQAAAETPAWSEVLTNSGDGGPGGLQTLSTHMLRVGPMPHAQD
jgi:DNA invertase Pin-like site-specific DNA recombinase